MIAERFVQCVNESRDSTALITKVGTYSYGELYRIVMLLSDKLSKMGLSKNEPIGIAFPNSMEFVALLLASEISGYPAVLLGAMLKSEEIKYHIINSGVRKVFAGKFLSNVFSNMECEKEEELIESIDCWNFNNQEICEGFVKGDFICHFTSGTNGAAKGVVRTSDAVLCEVDETVELIKLSKEDIVLTIPPIHHSYGLIAGTLAPLCAGARLILMDGFIPADVKHAIKTIKVTILFAVPFMYHILNQLDQLELEDFKSLRLCFSAGAPMPVEVAELFKERTGKYISQDYGSTETGVMCLNLNFNINSRTIGLPVGSRQIRAFDDMDKMLPPGAVGEIRTKSRANARCYLYPKELNEIAYKDGWLNIGDYGKVDENGYVTVYGRRSNMINVAGLKVDPVEVENVILDIPDIKEAVVLGIDSKTCGQIVKAVIVCEEGKRDKNDIIQFCRKKLAHYKVPKIIEFMDSIPRSSTGKILRKYLV